MKRSTERKGEHPEARRSMSSMYMPSPAIAYTAARLDRKVGGADSNGKDPGARERVLLSRSSQVNVGGVSPVRVSEEGYGAFSLLLPLSVSRETDV